jgi:hypothetical protein
MNTHANTRTNASAHARITAAPRQGVRNPRSLHDGSARNARTQRVHACTRAKKAGL